MHWRTAHATMGSPVNTLSLCKCRSASLLTDISSIFTCVLSSNFWEIVRSYSVTQRKQLLAFVTGSDRIPLGGLAKLKFIIVKNGPDSDR